GSRPLRGTTGARVARPELRPGGLNGDRPRGRRAPLEGNELLRVHPGEASGAFEHAGVPDQNTARSAERVRRGKRHLRANARRTSHGNDEERRLGVRSSGATARSARSASGHGARDSYHEVPNGPNATRYSSSWFSSASSDSARASRAAASSASGARSL